MLNDKVMNDEDFRIKEEINTSNDAKKGERDCMFVASILKGKPRYYSGSKNIRQREFLCCKEGFKVDEDPFEEKKLNKLETRTGCKAFVRLTVEDGIWKVTTFNPEHNHELALQSERHLQRFARHISKPKADVIDSMVNAGISTKNAYSYLREEVGGNENVGFTKRDCYNYVNKQKMTMISVGDAQSLLNHFKKKHTEDPMFFFIVQVDQKNRMTNFFWRDRRSRVNYDCFGDVVVFYTTYHTNKYNLICAPFVGVNHHWQNVMFGCAFLLDETTDSFIWLFKSFLESMGNRSPITIFTDQDKAMSNAIQVVFPNTHHRLCLWHILKNAPSHLGELNTSTEFKYLFNKCKKYCDSTLEFQQTWDNVIQKFSLESHRWLNMMYKIRHKWSTACTKDSFTAEFKASSRSESTNNVLNNIAVAGMRSSELDEDFGCKQGAPQKQVDCQDTVDVFELKEENSERVHIVHFDHLTNNISCSCKKFESLGVLCCHALRVFSVKNLTAIPSQYILKRWAKDAKKGIMAYEQRTNSIANAKEAEIIWRNSMIRIVNTTIYKSQGNDSLKNICQKILIELDEKIEREFERLRLGTDMHIEEDQTVQCDTTNMSVLDPPQARSKGKSKQVKQGPSHASLAVTYDITIFQPPNGSPYVRPADANIHGQSHPPWAMHTQDMDFANIPFTTMLQSVDVVNQFSQKNDSHAEKLRKQLCCHCCIRDYKERDAIAAKNVNERDV
ncbi:protein FAR1-RELATED SEQUENCE 5-like [Camellia sinensis]|uniref:protein FAR1-RELATED SEQUENCE 5-like n=1 Tax=Camellia sinensis TaxID=4442 RepID=UPI0010357EF3|nr:protein FAR1-RELATED SEQUENCE 5-like [Camellia sinensis]